MTVAREEVGRTEAPAGSPWEVFALLGADLRILHISAATEVLMGVRSDEIVGAEAFSKIHPADTELARETFGAVLASASTTRTVRVRARPLDGPWRHLELTFENRLEDPRVGALVVHGGDVTAQRRAAVSGCLEKRLVDVLPAAVVVTDDAGVVVSWNRRAERLFGYGADEALGRDVADLDWILPDAATEAIVDCLRDRGRWEGDFVARNRDGRELALLGTAEPFDAPEIGFRGVVTAFLDNAERRALQQALTHRAVHDPLTGLPNRTNFLERLDVALERRGREPGQVGVLFIDLDRFKLVNDSCGHQAGDEILRAVANLFEGVLRPGDIVARLGGDEFAVCCEGLAGPAEAVALAERLTAAVSQPFVADHREFYVTPSIGIVLGNGAEGETAGTLLRDADMAMYHAKDRGRARIELFDQRMHLDVLRRAEMASDLRHAIERDEFVLHYQPVVRLDDGALTGFEALIRWEHPTRGLLQPAEFIHVAEDTNLIVPIGSWVLADASRQLAAWRDALPEHPLTMSVNLSARQVFDPQLVALVRQALADNQLDPGRLCLEVTESVLMDDADVSVTTIRELKALGVQLAIDDFGTGYSSLAYLKRFPVDYLKIDRTFVSAVDRGAEDAVIVKAVVELGRALGLGVVAEGVETDEQLAELRLMGCDHAQGYRWARPAPAAAALAIAVGWRRERPSPRQATAEVAEEPTALASTSELLAVLTHELVTPLTVVMGQCERLSRMVADVPRAPDVVAAVARAAGRIEHLVDTLADAEQLDTGAVTLRVQGFDLVELVHDVVPVAVPSSREVRVTGDDNVLVEADARRVEQIVVNLLTNAHKFSPAGTPVIVTVRDGGDEVSLVVADEGPGVPPARVPDVFRKFSRLQRNTKGVGLGLFIARCLARAHGGDLHYRRRRPVGSELVLTLPATAVAGLEAYDANR